MRTMQLLTVAVLATGLATIDAAAQGAPGILVRVSHDAACVGAAIGAHIPHYEWEQRDVPRAMSISPGARGGAQVRVSLAY